MYHVASVISKPKIDIQGVAGSAPPNSNFVLISPECTKQEAVLTLPCECSDLRIVIKKGPQDSFSGTIPSVRLST